MNLPKMAREFLELNESSIDGEDTADVLARFGVVVLAAERARRAEAVVRRFERAVKWQRLGRMLRWWRGSE